MLLQVSFKRLRLELLLPESHRQPPENVWDVGLSLNFNFFPSKEKEKFKNLKCWSGKEVRAQTALAEDLPVLPSGGSLQAS